MRLTFFTLLLANALLFAYFHFDAARDAAGKSARAPIAPERIQLVPGRPSRDDAALATQTAKTCMSWTGLAPEKIAQAEAVLRELGFAERVTRPKVERFVVHIPPLKSKSEAEKKLAEVAALGVTDAHIIDAPGKLRGSIFFGDYPSEDEATVRLNELKEKGVRSAKLVPQPMPGPALLIEAVGVAQESVLRQRQAEFAGSALTAVDCPPR